MTEFKTNYPSISNLRKRTADGKRMMKNSYGLPALEAFDGAAVKWRLTEKIDGTNVRVVYHNPAWIEFRGRTDQAQMHKDLIKHLSDTFACHYNETDEQCVPKQELERLLEPGTVLFGEGYGAGIQKGGNYSADKRFVGFDVWNGQGYWHEYESVCDIFSELEVEHVEDYNAEQENYTFAELESMMHGLLSNDDSGLSSLLAKKNGNNKRVAPEGFVVRPKKNLYVGSDKFGSRLMFKIKARDYRLPLVELN